MTHSARSLLRNRRDRYAGLEIRLKTSKLSNAQAQRNAIARDCERTQRLAERARRALTMAMQRLEARVAHSGQLLGALSYRSVLTRGGTDMALLWQGSVGAAPDRVQRQVRAVEIVIGAGINHDPRQRAAPARTVDHLTAGRRRTDIVFGADQQQRRDACAPSQAGRN